MPRGKNYINQNKGMTLQAPTKSAVTEQCFYGAACQRKDCIYRHDNVGNVPKSTEPCMAYLAGLCTFDNKTCQKRHPLSDEECQRLIAKYKKTPCRFGNNCKTKGCLFIHTDADDASKKNKQQQQQSKKPTGLAVVNHPEAFPPLPGAKTSTTTAKGPPAATLNAPASAAVTWGRPPQPQQPVASLTRNPKWVPSSPQNKNGPAVAVAWGGSGSSTIAAGPYSATMATQQQQQQQQLPSAAVAMQEQALYHQHQPPPYNIPQQQQMAAAAAWGRSPPSSPSMPAVVAASPNNNNNNNVHTAAASPFISPSHTSNSDTSSSSSSSEQRLNIHAKEFVPGGGGGR